MGGPWATIVRIPKLPRSCPMDLPETMRQVVAREPGPPEMLGVKQAPVPRPRRGEALIQVAYAGINRPDCLQRAGGYPPPPDASPVIGLQLAKAFGAKVITTVGSADKAAYCRDRGADHALNYREQDFVAEVANITAKRGVDVVLDMVGGDYIEKNLRCLAIEGRMVFIGFQ